MSGSSMSGKAMLGLTAGLTLSVFPLPAWLPLPIVFPFPFPFPAELPLPFPFPFPLPLPKKRFPLPAEGLVIEPTVLVMPESEPVSELTRSRSLRLMVLVLPAEFPEPMVFLLPLLLPAELSLPFLFPLPLPLPWKTLLLPAPGLVMEPIMLERLERRSRSFRMEGRVTEFPLPAELPLPIVLPLPLLLPAELLGDCW